MAKIEPIKNKRGEVIYPITDTQAVEGLAEELAYKQETLVSGENIKKINGESILGGGNIIITGGGGTIAIDSELSETSENPVENKAVTQALNAKQDTLESGTNIKTINGESIVGQGDLFIQEGDPSAVKFAPQELTEEQKAQARANINAASLEDINNMDFVTAASLPTASESTMGYIYLIGPDVNNNYDRYFTQQEEDSYSWVPLGSTQINLSTYATQEEVDALNIKLRNLADTRYYGIFTSASNLPNEANERGYAYVGAATPLAIYEVDYDSDTEQWVWADTGVTVNAVQGEPGVGLDDVTAHTPADGTVVLHLSNGNTVTLALNHNHPQYAKAVICESLAEYTAISQKDPMTFYIVPEIALYLGNILVLEQGGAPLPYTPVSYIETDGDAYIDTGITGVPIKSAEIKVLAADGSDYTLLGSRGSSTDGEAKKFQMFRVVRFTSTSPESYKLGYGYYYSATSSSLTTDITNSVSDGTPFLAKGSFKSGAQSVSVKEEGDTTFKTHSTTYTKSITSSLSMYLFALNDNGTVGTKAPSGTKLYYCKIYSDENYSTLIFNGIPCYYNGEYGLWDKVSNTFFGAVSNSGTFTGPQIS